MVVLLGNIHYDDHCRICHRLGDLLCCETCPAVFHLACVDPPMDGVPEEDWQCGVCQAHKVGCLTVIFFYLVTWVCGETSCCSNRHCKT
jgi:hypothetical protein